MSTADAVSREANWLGTDPCPWPAGQTAPPNLLVANGGYFDAIQPYLPNTPLRSRALYVTRLSGDEQRISMGGVVALEYHLALHVWWPLKTPSGSLQTSSQDLDNALDALYQRIRGPQGDKTHNGAFAGGVVETVFPGSNISGTLHTKFDPPEKQTYTLTAVITYPACDIISN